MIPELRPYQTDALEAVCSARENGHNRVLVKMPTGTGKTVMFAAMSEWPRMERWLNQFPVRERKVLVIAHREELLDQAAAKFIAQNPRIRVGVEQADRYASSLHDVIVASIQTLSASKFRRLKRLLEQHRFRLVIVDEAHHAAADTYRTALALLGFLPMSDVSENENVEAAQFDDVAVMEAALQGWDAKASKDQLLVGVTATPNRSDAIGLGCVFQSIAYSYNLKDAIADKWLVPIKPWVIETKSTLDGVRTTRGDFNQRDLADAVNNPQRNNLAVAGWLDYAADRPTLCFTVDVAHAHAMAEEFRRYDIKAEALSGETPRDVRRGMLERYTAGDLQVITNCMVLTEGTDLPATGCILHAKPTKSPTLYEQMTGRGLRIHPSKEDCIILDVVDIARKHSLQTAPMLYGLPPSLKGNGKTLEEMRDLLEELLAKHPGWDIAGAGRKTLEELNAIASTFDIWQVPSMGDFAAGLTMNWIRAGEERFRLEYPWSDHIESLQVDRDLLGKWQVTLGGRRIEAVPGARAITHQLPDRVIATGVGMAQAALQLAEAFVQQERRSVIRLKDREAPWRSRPASPKQLQMLTRMHAPIKPGITSGEASDLIDVALARKRAR